MSRKKRCSAWTERRAQMKARRDLGARDRTWAERWFAGTAACPACGGVQFTMIDTDSGGDTCIETFRCNQTGCKQTWKVELRESAVSVIDRQTGESREWFDREEIVPQPVFRIEIVDGVVEAVRFVAGDPCARAPKFLVREIESDHSIEPDRIAGVDDQGRPVRRACGRL